MTELYIFAHRGCSGAAPENTLRAFKLALESGADGIELDVQLSRDNQLIVFHDDDLSRCTGVSGTVAQKTAAELRELRIGGEKLPTLTEVLDLIAGKLIVNIELKAPALAGRVSALIEQCVDSGVWKREQFLVSSFDHSELERLAALNPLLRIGALVRRERPNLVELKAALNLYSLNAPANRLDAALVDSAHAAGLKVFAYTVNDEKGIARLRSLGVDGVFTDFPEKVSRA